MAVTLSIEVDESVEERFARLAAYSRHSLAELQVMALERFLAEEMDDLERLLESRRQAAEGLTVPHEEVMAWLRSLATDHPLPRPQAHPVVLERAS